MPSPLPGTWCLCCSLLLAGLRPAPRLPGLPGLTPACHSPSPVCSVALSGHHLSPACARGSPSGGLNAWGPVICRPHETAAHRPWATHLGSRAAPTTQPGRWPFHVAPVGAFTPWLPSSGERLPLPLWQRPLGAATAAGGLPPGCPGRAPRGGAAGPTPGTPACAPHSRPLRLLRVLWPPDLLSSPRGP